MAEHISAAVNRAASLLAKSRYAVALVGSGLSVESGVPTFRGPEGLWNKLGQPSTSGYKMFLLDPEAWWTQQEDLAADPVRTEFRRAIDRAEPNAGHVALAELERTGVLKMTVTQNVDNLHRAAGSIRVAEIHGNRTKIRCIGCESRWPRQGFEIGESPPRCPECGDLVKTDTVMFGEPIPPRILDLCCEETDRSDCMLAVGTSATVYPAANLPNRVIAAGGDLIEINTEPTPLSSRATLVLRGRAAEVLPLVVERVKAVSGIARDPIAVGRNS